MVRGIVAGPSPVWLTAINSAALVQSAQLHACHVRTQLVCHDPQRTLMLLVAAALSVGYAERVGEPANASFAVLSVLGASLLVWGMQKKLVARSE